MRKIFTFLFAALMSVGMWADPTVVTWYPDDVFGSGSGTMFSKDGVTLNCTEIANGAIWCMGDPGTFTTTLGNFTKIEITTDWCDPLAGWEESSVIVGWDEEEEKEIKIPKWTWTGDAASVSFNGDFGGLSSIVFTIGPAAPATVAVTGVTLDQSEAQMTVGGETLTLTATVNPEGATDKSVSWSTSDGNVATVENGVVTAVAAGTATITVTTTDGSYTATCDVTVTAPAPANSCGPNLTWEFNPSTGVLTISGTGAMYDYDEEENYAPWISSYHESIESITSVIISDGVTSIGQCAFFHCTGLTSVTIPNSVNSIGAGAFMYCDGLTSVTIGNSVESIGMYAFVYCTGLTSVTIGNSVTSIGVMAFAYCIGLTSVTIPEGVTSIGDGAFGYVPNIVYSGSASGTPWGARSVNGYVDGFLVYSNNTKTNLLACSSQATGTIEIPNSVTSIGVEAFLYCLGITSITIPNSVTSIGGYAFADCSTLETVTINAESLESYGSYAFDGTAEDLTIYVPAGSVDTYKTAWADYADQIEAIPGGDEPEPTDEQVPTNVDPENPSYYYSTFFHSTQNYKLTNDGTTAFIADLSGSDLILTEIAKGSEVIPANTAVIFRKAGSAEPVALTPTEENGVSVNPEDNDLEGVDAITAVTSIDGLTRDNCYVLSGQQSVGFYLINSDNLKAHKAYVKYVSTPGQGNAPKKMRFVFNTTTGVESAQPSVISGQKLIENGQLIIIKNGVRYNAQGQIVK